MNPSLRSSTVQSLLARREWVQRLARTLVRDPHRAADLAQETMAAALERPPANSRAPRAWLGTVLRNAHRRELRSAARRARREQVVARSGTSAATLDVVMRAEMHERVVRAVLELDEPYRRTVLLRYYDRLSPRDVARRMQVPVETVRTRTKRALGHLRMRLDERSRGSDRCQALLTTLAGSSPTMNAIAGLAALGVLTMKSKLIAALAVLLLGLGLYLAGPFDADTDSAAPARPPEEQTEVAGLEGRVAHAQLHQASDATAEATARPGPPTGVLAGTARMQGGRPVAGAHVVLNAGGDAVAGAKTRATTNAEGEFHFEELASGIHELAVGNSYGYILGPSIEVELASGEQRDGVVLVVPETYMITGTLVGEDGGPLPHTQVELMPLDPTWRIGSHATTDEAGRFRILGLRDEQHKARVRNYTAPEPIDAGARDVRVVYRASDMRTLAGTVLDAQGRLVPRASFAVLVGPRGRQRQYITRVQDGRFEIEIPRSEARHDFSVYQVKDAEGHPLDVQPWRRNEAPLPDDELEIRLQPGRALTGYVVDTHGSPLSGVRIRLVAQANKDRTMLRVLDNPSVTSAEDGGFVFERLYDGTLNLTIQGVPGWSHSGRVSVPPDDHEITIRLRPSSDIGGTLIDGRGEPVANQQVVAWRGRPGEQRAVAKSDTQGRFTLTDLSGTGTYRLRVGSLDGKVDPRFATHLLHGVEPGTIDLVLELKPPQTIEGVVITHADKPQPWASVSAEIQLADGTWVQVAREYLGGKRHRFKLRGLPASLVRVTAQASRGPHLPAMPIEVIAPARDIVVRLRPGVVLQGRIRTRGLPASALRGGGAVWISTRGGRELWGRSAFLDDSGHFKIEGLPAESGALFVWTKAHDLCAWVPDVRSDAGLFEIVLTPGLSIEGSVFGLAPDAKEPMVWATRVGGEPSNVIWSTAIVAPDGRFVIKALPPGRYVVGGTYSAGKEVRAKAGATGIKLDWGR